MAPINNTDKVVQANATDKLKKFFEDKDWKFYCAVAAGLTLAGASAYYLTAPSNKKGKKKPEADTKKHSGNISFYSLSLNSTPNFLFDI